MKRKKPSCVNATLEARQCIQELRKNSQVCGKIDEAIALLNEDMFAGKSVEKKRIPEYYKEKYMLHNLYVLNLDTHRRLTYTLISDTVGVSVNVIEVFLNHKQYEDRFGYN